MTAQQTTPPQDILSRVDRQWGRWNRVEGYQPIGLPDSDEVIGWTFRVGQLHNARYGWVTASGTVALALEDYRDTAAELVPYAVSEGE